MNSNLFERFTNLRSTWPFSNRNHCIEMVLIFPKWIICSEIQIRLAHQSPHILLKFDPLIRFIRSLHKDQTKPHTKVKSGVFSIMHDNNVMPRHTLSSDLLKTHVTNRFSLDLCVANGWADQRSKVDKIVSSHCV